MTPAIAKSPPERDPPDRVCVITHPLSDAGENATRTLLSILGDFSTTSLLTADLPRDSTIRENHETVEVMRRPMSTNAVVAAIQFLWLQARMITALPRRPEPVCLFFGASSYFLPILFARVLGKTVLVQPRGDVPLTLRLQWERTLPDLIAKILACAVRLLERASFRVASGVVTYTPTMAIQLGLDPTSPSVHADAARYVDTDRFSVRTPFDERDRTIGLLGRLDEEKGIRQLPALVGSLPADVRLTCIGDGPLRDWLEAELAEELAAGRVEITGWIDHYDVPAALNELQLLLVPSKPTEGLPTAILEAMACGTPVLASPVAGVSDVVLEGHTGFLLSSTDADAIAADVRRALAHEDLAGMSNNCRNLAVSTYGFESAVERYRRVFARARSES